MARVDRVSVEVLLDNGDRIVLNVEQPAPGGDNPAFLTAQVHTALAMLEPRMHDALEVVYGRQHFREPRPSDELLSPSARSGGGADGSKPKAGQLVRFPDVYGDNTFTTVDPDAGIYEVYQPRGLPKGDHVQVNTDAARWVVVTHEELRS